MKQTPPLAVDRIATLLAALLAAGAAAAEFCIRRLAGRRIQVRTDPLTETSTLQSGSGFFSWGGSVFWPLRGIRWLLQLLAAGLAAAVHLAVRHLLKRRKRP